MRNEVVVQMYMFIGSNSVVLLRSTSNRQTVGRRPFITTGTPFAHAAVTTQEDGPFVPACQVVQEFLCNRRPPLQSTPILHSGGGYVWLYKAHHCCVETRCTVLRSGCISKMATVPTNRTNARAEETVYPNGGTNAHVSCPLPSNLRKEPATSAAPLLLYSV